MAQALYRKHRSKSLDEVIGQEHITDTLKAAIKKGMIAHAYLFTGPRGVGKTSVARILAHQINDIDYLGEDTHLDIIEIDAASNRRIDEMRELRDKVHIAPTSSKYKVYIIDEVHMLTREAFNALLKTLEEPPEHVVFILATTEAHKVPETIISRTQRYTFKPIEHSKSVDHLKAIAKRESINIDDAALELLSKHGQGSFRDSISMLDQLSGMQKDSYDESDVRLLLGLPSGDDIQNLLNSLKSGDRKAVLKQVDQIKGEGHESSLTINALTKLLRDQFISEDFTIPAKQSLQLMRELQTVRNPSYMSLELALLSVIDTDTSSEVKEPEIKKELPEVKEKTKKVELKIPLVKVEVNKNTQANETSETSEQKPNDDSETSSNTAEKPPADFTETWNKLLIDVKPKHNTLHGILRMAQPQLDNNSLVLLFSFGFHKKQLESPKNNSVMRQYIKKHLGDIELSIVVEKSAKKPEDKPAEKAEKKQLSSDVENVSNIFSGAELLE